MVVESGMESSSGGRKPTLVKLHDGHSYAMGVDLGHTGLGGATMIGVVTDLSGRVLHRIEKKEKKTLWIRSLTNPLI